MNAIEIIENTNCHDSSIIELSMDSDHIHLQFEGVCVNADNCYKVAVDLRDVRKAIRDHQIVHGLGMEGEFADVLDFIWSGHTARLLVEWWSFPPRKAEFCSYEFEFDTFALQAEKQESAEGE